MKVVFYGGRQAGMICLLTLLARGDKVLCVVPVDDLIEDIAEEHGLNVFRPDSINSERSERHLSMLSPDILVCAHGREILKQHILRIPRRGCINVHPCLYRYKGANPIQRLLADGETKASVGVHWMIEKVDSGDVIEEVFVDVRGCDTITEVYNRLYPVYSIALRRAMKKLELSKEEASLHKLGYDNLYINPVAVP